MNFHCHGWWTQWTCKYVIHFLLFLFVANQTPNREVTIVSDVLFDCDIIGIRTTHRGIPRRESRRLIVRFHIVVVCWPQDCRKNGIGIRAIVEYMFLDSIGFQTLFISLKFFKRLDGFVERRTFLVEIGNSRSRIRLAETVFSAYARDGNRVKGVVWIYQGREDREDRDRERGSYNMPLRLHEKKFFRVPVFWTTRQNGHGKTSLRADDLATLSASALASVSASARVRCVCEFSVLTELLHRKSFLSHFWSTLSPLLQLLPPSPPLPPHLCRSLLFLFPRFSAASQWV